MVFATWFVVYNEEEEEYYLWSRKRAWKASVTMRDIEKVLPPGISLQSLSPESISRYYHLIPIHKRVARGVLWNEVVRARSGIIKDQIESIESAEKYGGGLQVVEVAAWTAYPGKRSYKV